MAETITSVVVPANLTGAAYILRSTEYSALIFGVAAFPGYWLATATVDRIGRKPIQMAGFIFMGICFMLLWFFPYIEAPAYVLQFLAVYGISYFFIEFGPNVTTFINPPEVFPASIRGMGTGISSSAGKIGAFSGTFANFIILGILGESKLFGILSIVSLAGFILTLLTLPETKQKVLEEVSSDFRLNGGYELQSK